jgi:hypothetical protein
MATSNGINYSQTQGLKLSTNNLNRVIVSTGGTTTFSGVTSGSTIIDIRGTQGQLMSVTDNINGLLLSVNSFSGTSIFQVNNNNSIIGGTPGANAFVISGTNIGIGTSSPSVKLDVYGNDTTKNTVQFGTIGIQSYATNNAWFGDNVYFNGTQFIRRDSGYSGLFYFAGNEGQFRFGDSGSTNTAVTNGYSTYGTISLKTNLDGTFAVGNMWWATDNYTGAKFIVNSSGNVGVGTISPTNKLHVNSTSDPLKLEGVQTGTDTEFLTIGTDGVVHKTTSTTPTTRKLILKTIELGSKNVNTPSYLDTKLSDFLKNIFNNDCIINEISGLKYDFYFTINDYGDNERKKVLYTTKYQNEVPGTIFIDMIDWIYNVYEDITVNFYVEAYIDVDYRYDSPTQMKLVNPLFNSLRPTKYSRGGHSYQGQNQYLRNILSEQPSLPTPYVHSNNIRSQFYNGWANYYDYNTSNDIPRKIYDIVNSSPGLYGDGYLRDSSITALFNGYDNDVRESLNNATYVESNKNVYSKFKIPVNQHGFLQSIRHRNHNFYGTLLYDIVGGSNGDKRIYSSNSNIKSEAFLQMVDTYRIYSEGNPGIIFTNTELESDTQLNNLQFNIGIPKNLKYISPSNSITSYGNRRDRSYIQVLPGYSETYLLKIEVIDYPGDDGINIAFLESLRTDYLVANDSSNPISHQFWTNSTTVGFVNEFYPPKTILYSNTNFNDTSINPYGKYIIIQSNDEKMYTLSQNPIYSSISGSIRVDAIYKGHSFRPLLYPLNFSQLLLEVPESFYYDLDTDSLIASKNSDNNKFPIDKNTINHFLIDRQLRLIVKYKKLNKYDIIDFPLKFTATRGSFDNKIFELTIEYNTQSIERSIIEKIKKHKLKNFKPGNVEIYFAFLKIDGDNSNLNKTSIIPNYKMIITKYGDNEVFKLIRENSDNNIVFP